MAQDIDEQRLIERLAKVETLFARATADGERAAAGSARERLLQRLVQFECQEPVVEHQFRLPDDWSRALFMALLRRYDIKPYRYQRQRRTTVMARVTASFVTEVLWPEFDQLNDLLREHLKAVTERVISQAIHSAGAEAELRAGQLPAS